MKPTIETIDLKKGSHKTPNQGLCVMEAVALFAGEPHSDRPQCACPALTEYMITLNDNFTDEERQLLKPYITRLIGTRDGKALDRAKVLAWASVTQFAPYALEANGFKKEAEALRNVPHYDWSAAWFAASAASAARSAAWFAARSAASAARSAASAARSAASAAWSAASAAWSAAESRHEVIAMALSALDEALKIRGDS